MTRALSGLRATKKATASGMAKAITPVRSRDGAVAAVKRPRPSTPRVRARIGAVTTATAGVAKFDHAVKKTYRRNDRLLPEVGAAIVAWFLDRKAPLVCRGHEGARIRRPQSRSGRDPGHPPIG
jgi:hypothetical protein